MQERDKDDIRHQIDLLFRAYIDQDPQKLRATFARDWCGFNPTSSSLIRGLNVGMAEAKTVWANWPLLDYQMIEIDYVFYGDVCVVPYIARVRSMSTDGDLSEFKLRSVAVYVHQEETWRQVAANTSLHPPDQPRSL